MYDTYYTNKTVKKNVNARTKAKSISNGSEKESHIGKKTNAVLDYEYFSLINVKPMFRGKDWFKKWNETTKEGIKRGIHYSLLQKYQYLNKIPK